MRKLRAAVAIIETGGKVNDQFDAQALKSLPCIRGCGMTAIGNKPVPFHMPSCPYLGRKAVASALRKQGKEIESLKFALEKAILSSL